MKSAGGLWPRIVAVGNLHDAMLRAARGKRDRPAVARFLADADTELAQLAEELRSGCYRPRPYTQFRICDPKPRTISCADIRDRVVHQALCHVIGPVIDRRMVAHSYACRDGKGAHRAVTQAQVYCRRFRFCLDGLPFLGLRVFPQALRLQHERYGRLRRLIRRREFAAGDIDAEALSDSLCAAVGILSYWGLRGLARTETEV